MSLKKKTQLLKDTPEKKVFDNMNQKLISKRRRFFQYFIDHLISIPVIKSSMVFYDFLNISDEKEFNKVKENYENQDF